eukprot:2276892-Amphidinium_carterae.1
MTGMGSPMEADRHHLKATSRYLAHQDCAEKVPIGIFVDVCKRLLDTSTSQQPTDCTVDR